MQAHERNVTRNSKLLRHCTNLTFVYIKRLTIYASVETRSFDVNEWTTELDDSLKRCYFVGVTKAVTCYAMCRPSLLLVSVGLTSQLSRVAIDTSGLSC